MANTARTQIALTGSAHFVSRLEAALVKVAWAVLGEDPGTANHAARVAYANRALGNPGSYAATLARIMVYRTNVFAFATSYDFDLGATVTAAGDPDLESQLTTDWNTLAGA